jgi:hypothetical protein
MVSNRRAAGRALKRLLPLLNFTLLLAAWGAYLLGQHRASALDLSQFGRCEDVYDALRRNASVAGYLVPYFGAAVALDGLAAVALIVAAVRAQIAVRGFVAAAVLCHWSAVWHMMCWVMASVFAS